jgi:hypothetical protein
MVREEAEEGTESRLSKKKVTVLLTTVNNFIEETCASEE